MKKTGDLKEFNQINDATEEVQYMNNKHEENTQDIEEVFDDEEDATTHGHFGENKQHLNYLWTKKGLFTADHLRNLLAKDESATSEP